MNAARQLKIDTRRSTILNFLRETELPISEIANRLDVSANTIRKDLEALQSAGHSMSVNGVVKLAP
jgi:DeoR/GlpR family transcriptional regulator of sugar metabolism